MDKKSIKKMTAAQKKAQARFKAAVAEAKKLRKASPKLSQAEAVKKAFQQLYGAPKKRKKIGDFLRSGTKVKDEKGAKKYKKADYKTTRKTDGTFRKWTKIGATKETRHTDTKSHNVNIRVVSGMPAYKDKDAAREIQLYADNDSQLYYQRRKPIILNLQKKYKKGMYDVAKAAKLWRYYIDAALQKYHKEYGSKSEKWHALMSVGDRNLLAQEYALDTLKEFNQGEFLD